MSCALTGCYEKSAGGEWEYLAVSRVARICLSLCLLLPAIRFTLYEVLLAQTEGEMS